jgi:competence protein ComEC
LNEIFSARKLISLKDILTMVAGIISAQQFASLPPPWVLVLGGVLAVLFWVFRLGMPAAFLFGLVWALGVATFRLHDGLPPAMERRDLLVEGVVMDLPTRFDEGWRFIFKTDAVLEPEGSKLPRQFRLGWYKKDVAVKAGEHWRLRVRLKRPHGFFNAGGMDYELWMFSQGIRANGYVREDAKNQKLADASPFSTAGLRQSLFDMLTKTLAGRDMAGIVIALVMGAENAISQEQWEVLRRTGTAHLVAISGSHISLISGLVFIMVRLACSRLCIMRLPPHSIAALAACIAAFLYSALADFAIPTQRALVMIFVVMAAVITQRNVKPLPTLALALAVVSLYDPLAVLAPGFWLSYGAVGLILLVISGRLRPSGWWADLCKINWATSMGLAPLLLVFFQQVSLISPVANLIAVPSIGFILTPVCLLGAVLLVTIPPVGVFVLHGAEISLQWIWWMLQQLSDLPWAQWQHSAPPAWTLPFALVGAALLLAPRGIPARWLGWVMLVPALTVIPRPPDDGHFRLTLLDVGQALAVTVQTHSHALVFDTGAKFGKNFDAGEAVVEPFLRQQGLNGIDALVVSHGDNDHIGGADSLIRHVAIGKIVSSVPGMLPARAEPCQAGQSFEWDGVRFDMLSPFGTLGNENNNSCVLRVSSPSGSALLTGDIERAAESLIVERYGDGLKADILIAPHHGSKTSSTEAFLAAVKPAYVFIPMGYLNRYNFPHPDVLKRYQAINAKVLDSAHSGSITVDSGLFPPEAYRETHGKYWNAKD